MYERSRYVSAQWCLVMRVELGRNSVSLFLFACPRSGEIEGTHGRLSLEILFIRIFLDTTSHAPLAWQLLSLAL